MYAISKLSTSSIQFVGAITSAGASRSKLWAIAVAFVLARALALPAERTEDIVSYYRLQCATGVLELLGRLNEVIPMDTSAVRDLVIAFYSQRYDAANPPVIPLALRQDRGLVDFFGLARNFPEDVLEEIQTGSVKLCHYVTGLTVVFEELQKNFYNVPTAVSDEKDTFHAA